MTRDVLRDVVAREIKALDGAGPEELLEIVNMRLIRRGEVAATDDEVVDLLTEADPNNHAKTQFRIQLSWWDKATDADTWLASAEQAGEADTPERRHLIYRLLGFEPRHWPRLDEEYPTQFSRATVISTELPWEPWYTEERKRRHSFYWEAYERVLHAKRWPAESIRDLDDTAQKVVERLADPTRENPYQSKGLVVGHVQSGKTANFTGVVAKAIDAGYRLVIVLTGTVEILRRQTQRRLDMELIGEENILGGTDRQNPAALAEVDYQRDGDQDWFAGKFLHHGINPVDFENVPAIRRLTSSNGDYKNLKQGLDTLDFRAGNELVDKRKPLFHEDNLFRSDVRIAVVKKHKGTLENLVTDLGNIHADLGEIPALIIDDEADQASVNTVNPRSSGRQTREERERSAINKQIAALMRRLKRCQYVGYTATPFANVFIDPDDSEDVFPKDFIISLDPPPGYMGGAAFHDLSERRGDEEPTPETSNERAFVRDLHAVAGGDAERDERQRAVDAFVLSGAIRLYRAEVDPEISCPHHTMLVHETVKQEDHKVLAGELRKMWAQSGFSTPGGLARLRSLWDEDYRPVCDARAAGAPVPSSFDELRPFIGRAVDKISQGMTPVLIVNGDTDKDYEQDALDFQAGDVWKILVGGSKLSRGFTVEGLTVSYYKRRAGQADTLMQAGRWFGFRPGYRDLVRLYIGRNVPGPRNTSIDLYEAFGAVVQDEEDFRDELKRYADLTEDGKPCVRPEDVPPMVFQQLPWLKPTQSTKMYNAELTEVGSGAKVQDFFMVPGDRARRRGANRDNFDAVRPLLSAAGESGEFFYHDCEYKGECKGECEGRAGGPYTAYYGIVDNETVVYALARFAWMENWDFKPHMEFVRRAIKEQRIEDWAVLLPWLGKSKGLPPETRYVGSHGAELPVIKRKRRQNRGGFSGSSFRQRDALLHIADSVERPYGGPLAESLRTGKRGALMLNLAADDGDPESRPEKLPEPTVDAGDIATLVSWVLPRGAAPRGRIGFKVRKKNGGVIIDRSVAG